MEKIIKRIFDLNFLGITEKNKIFNADLNIFWKNYLNIFKNSDERRNYAFKLSKIYNIPCILNRLNSDSEEYEMLLDGKIKKVSKSFLIEIPEGLYAIEKKFDYFDETGAKYFFHYGNILKIGGKAYLLDSLKKQEISDEFFKIFPDGENLEKYNVRQLADAGCIEQVFVILPFILEIAKHNGKDILKTLEEYLFIVKDKVGEKISEIKGERYLAVTEESPFYKGMEVVMAIFNGEIELKELEKKINN